MIDKLLRKRLDHLQFSEQPCLLLMGQVPVGYGAQISGRLLGLKLALALDRKAVFPSASDWPYVQTVVPPFSWNGDLRTIQKAPLIDVSGLDGRSMVRFDYLAVDQQLRSRGTDVQEWIDRLLAARLDLTRDDLQKFDGWLLSWLQFLPELESRLRLDMERLGVSKGILGVHIRRGDKKVETPYVSPERINTAISRIYSKWKFSGVFVASDCPDAPSFLKLPAGVSILFDEQEMRYNNANHRMLSANPTMSSQETYVAFKNMRLLGECGGVVGQQNAHFATLAASYIFNRDSRSERLTLIDPNCLPKLVLIKQRLKWGLRSLVKSAVPRSLLARVDHFIHKRSG